MEFIVVIMALSVLYTLYRFFKIRQNEIEQQQEKLNELMEDNEKKAESLVEIVKELDKIKKNTDQTKS